MREAYLQNSCFERFLVFQAKSKANASFNQYVIARSYARFSCLMSGEGLILYVVSYQTPECFVINTIRYITIFTILPGTTITFFGA
jgi:hypothetical protein